MERLDILDIQKRFKSSAQKKFFIFITVFIVISGLMVFFNFIGLFSNLNNALTDNLYGGRSTLDNIVILAIDDQSINEIGRWPWDREIFADVLKKIENERVIGIDVSFFEPSDNESDLAFSEELVKHNVVLASEFLSFKQEDGRVLGDVLFKPIPVLDANAKTGYVNVITDKDGVTRRVNLNLSRDEDYFAYVIYDQAFASQREKKDEFIINFPAEPYSFNFIPVKDVLSENFDNSAFEDKIVLIGATSEDLHDNFFVPISHGVSMPGVELQAVVIQTLLNNNDLHYQGKLVTGLLISLMALIVLLLIYYTRPFVNLPILVAFIIIYEISAIRMFERNIIVDPIYIPLTIVVSYLAYSVASYIIEYKMRHHIKNAFGKYISPVVVDQLINDKDKLKLGGEERDVTIFFSDIRGFTTISEHLSARDLVGMLNEYLTINTNIILENDGTIDKYIGDAIMAFWGAPIHDRDYAVKAAKTCVELKYALENIKRTFKLKYNIDFDIGIGLNTGRVIVGNIGSDKRFDYTIIGDEVNLGSRLEGLTKQYGVNIIISDSTKKKLNRDFISRELDLVAVKGKEKPVAIFELIDLKKNLKNGDLKKLQKHIEEYEKGLSLYKKSKFREAIFHFEKAAKLRKNKSSEIMIDRCREFIKNRPKEFKGVYVAKTK